MPLYEYHCEANGLTIEVVHRMAERFETWGQLCAHARRDLGDTPADAPVRKLVGSGSAMNAPATLQKQNAARAESSKYIGHGATVAPMRNSKF
jgi:predicted nucleic acid-binding Zn ribbon protein